MALHKRNPGAGNASGASEMDQAARLIFSEHSDNATDKQDALPLIGRGNRFFSRAILTAWSPGALAAMDVRWRETGERVCREVSR